MVLRAFQRDRAELCRGEVSNQAGRGVRECHSPRDAAKINFGSYWGIIMVTNHRNDGGACSVGRESMEIQGKTYDLACVVFDPDSMYTAFAGHEVGHGLGFQHSYDLLRQKCGGSPGEYCDPYDIMSALDTKQFDAINFPTGGPGLN